MNSKKLLSVKMLAVLTMLLIQTLVYSQNQSKRIQISNNLELEKISEHSYLHISYSELPKYGRISANGLILIDNKEAFLFNSPWNDALTEELISWLKNKMGIKIVGFIPNHWHADCMGGLKYIQSQKIESYAKDLTIEIAKSKNKPVPAVGFKDSLQLNLGNKTINCYYLGAAHSLDNIAVWIPSENILFAGCMIRSAKSNDLGNTEDGDLKSYPETIVKLSKKFSHAKIVIPGHGEYGGPELIKHTQKLSRL